MAPIVAPKTMPSHTGSNNLRDDLRHIKRLFLEKDYKACATKSASLLAQDDVHAIEQTFLHYYAGSAHELLAQPMQNFSPSKLANLYDAKQHFELALVVLDEIRPRSRLSHGSASSMEGSSQGSESPEQSVASPGTPEASTRTINFSRKQRMNTPSPGTMPHGKMNVLDVSPAQWLAGDSPTATISPTCAPEEKIRDISNLPSSSPPVQKRCNCRLPKHNSGSILQSAHTHEVVMPISAKPAMDPCLRTVVPNMRCSRLATELAALIEHHISWIEDAIKSVAGAHQRRVDVTGLDIVDTKKKTLQYQAGLAVRRARSRKRPRYDSSATQRLCKQALEEL